MGATFLGTVDVALILKCSTEYVRQLEKAGKLSAERTPSGRRIFRTDEVERLAAERERQKRRSQPESAETE
jgi:predicted site-specific integrase-resolvase